MLNVPIKRVWPFVRLPIVVFNYFNYRSRSFDYLFGFVVAVTSSSSCTKPQGFLTLALLAARPRSSFYTRVEISGTSSPIPSFSVVVKILFSYFGRRFTGRVHCAVFLVLKFKL